MMILISAIIWLSVSLVLMIFATPLLRGKSTEAVLDQYARAFDLALPAEVRPGVVERIRTHELSTVRGYLGGGVLGFLGYLALPDAAVTLPDNETSLLPLLFAMFGVFLGTNVAPMVAAVTLTSRSRTGIRFARPVTPSLTDYVPRLELRFVNLAIGCLAALFVTCMLATGLGGRQDLRSLLVSTGAFYTYAAIVLVVLGRILSLRIAQTGQTAGSVQELAWDDAFRARALNGMAFAPQFLAVMAWLNLVPNLVPEEIPTKLALLLIVAGGVVPFGFWTLKMIMVDSPRVRQHWRLRLWSPDSTVVR